MLIVIVALLWAAGLVQPREVRTALIIFVVEFITLLRVAPVTIVSRWHCLTLNQPGFADNQRMDMVKMLFERVAIILAQTFR